MLEVRFSARAVKEFSKIDGKARRRIEEKIKQYANEPAALAANVKRLRGEGTLRLRVGDFRVVFFLEGRTMTILKIAHRREIYRN